MIQIKTQNIPLETFPPLQEKKLEPDKSGEEFSIVFNASYNAYLETETKSSEDKFEEAGTSKSLGNIEGTEEVEKLEDLKDAEDLENREDEEIDWDNLGMSRLLETYPSNEDNKAEESSGEDFLTDTLQVRHLDENLTDTIELETVEHTSIEVKEIAEEFLEYLSTEEAHQNVSKDGFTTMMENGVGKNLEHESLEALQTLEISRDKGALGEDRISEENGQVDNNLLDKINVKDEKSNKVEQHPSEKITSKSEIKAMLDSKKEIETANLPDEHSKEKLILKTVENKKLESDIKGVIEETKIEVIADEPLNPAFERGIEQLKNLRIFEPQTQNQKIVEVPETEWVNQMESIIIEEMHSENGMDKVSTTRIQLTPEHLGKMDIELVLKEKGLTARLVVEHADTKEWMEQKIAELTIKLSAQNIEVTDFQISITENSQNLLDTGMQGNPFSKEKEDPENQRKNLKYSSEKESAVETIDNKPDLGNGRLSMWV